MPIGRCAFLEITCIVPQHTFIGPICQTHVAQNNVTCDADSNKPFTEYCTS